jgi:xanthine dehydrogenase molybdopterin-binding subunit B
MIENIMERIARNVGKDPLEVRMINLPAESEMKKILLDFSNSVGEFE